jgi:hypothetical protein|tara:strand:- start:1 stop:648 length:648 start_codon:yes stop_codon:yes gene_type:complete
MYTGPHIITDGLILIMNADSARSYPGTGTTWLDLSGNDINGTLSSSTMATVVPGEMRLNNSTDKINYGHNTLLEPVSITVSAWVNLDNRNNRHILITKWYGYSFEVASNGQPYFRLNGPGDQYSSEALTWGEWYLITGTFDNSTKKHDCYVNGVNKGTSIKSSSIVYNQGSFNIPYTGNPVHAKGEISTLSIYNRALTSDEVMQNYNAQKSRFGL